MLLNCVTTDINKLYVLSKINKINEKGISVSPMVVQNAIKKLKLGKSSGHDGLSAGHFKFADRSMCFYLSILFTSIISHGYIPDNFMKTVLLPIIKSKTGDIHDVNNYRPISLVTSCSKLFELILLDIIDMYIQTTENQFGFKSKHATDMCIFTIKNIIDYYRRQKSPVFSCFLDASKAFDRVNHWTLFSKLINCKVPLLLVRVIVYWYRTQLFYIRWGPHMSDSFKISNGVRQE